MACTHSSTFCFGNKNIYHYSQFSKRVDLYMLFDLYIRYELLQETLLCATTSRILYQIFTCSYHACFKHVLMLEPPARVLVVFVDRRIASCLHLIIYALAPFRETLEAMCVTYAQMWVTSRVGVALPSRGDATQVRKYKSKSDATRDVTFFSFNLAIQAIRVIVFS